MYLEGGEAGQFRVGNWEEGRESLRREIDLEMPQYGKQWLETGTGDSAGTTDEQLSSRTDLDRRKEALTNLTSHSNIWRPWALKPNTTNAEASCNAHLSSFPQLRLETGQIYTHTHTCVHAHEGDGRTQEMCDTVVHDFEDQDIVTYIVERVSGDIGQLVGCLLSRPPTAPTNNSRTSQCTSHTTNRHTALRQPHCHQTMTWELPWC